jgi:hypothetical protein
VTQRSKGSKSAATEAPIVDIAHSSSDEVYDSSEKSDSDFSLAAGLKFSNDRDVLDLHIDLDDEMRSSFPKDTHPKTLILGGPQPPDPTGVLEDKYRKLRIRKRRSCIEWCDLAPESRGRTFSTVQTGHL